MLTTTTAGQQTTAAVTQAGTRGFRMSKWKLIKNFLTYLCIILFRLLAEFNLFAKKLGVTRNTLSCAKFDISDK